MNNKEKKLLNDFLWRLVDNKALVPNKALPKRIWAKKPIKRGMTSVVSVSRIIQEWNKLVKATEK